MDPGSGVFTCPIAGSYLFIVHVCSADMHKALLSIRYLKKIHLFFFQNNSTYLHTYYNLNISILL